MDSIDTILSYWFGDDPSLPMNNHPKTALWWKKDPAVDADVRERFAGHLERAANGEYDAWTETAPGTLALIILFDQMSRNMYRDQAQMYAHDDRAVELSLSLVESGRVRELPLVQRSFAIMPLMHAEDRGVQEKCVRAFEDFVKDGGGAGGLEYAIKHKVIVDRFGRFPHRNAILGRESTPEELAFLEQPGSSF